MTASTTATTPIHRTTDTQCDAKISMYFSHTVEIMWKRERQIAAANTPRTATVHTHTESSGRIEQRQRLNTVTETENANWKIVIFLVLRCSLCCRFMLLYICVVCFAFLYIRGHVCSGVVVVRVRSSFECPIELNTYMWPRLAVAEYNKTLHMHTQNDRFLLRQK